MNAFLVRYRPNFSDEIMERVIVLGYSGISDLSLAEIADAIRSDNDSHVVSGMEMLEVRSLGPAIITPRTIAVLVFRASKCVPAPVLVERIAP